jgi:hypothetical protein
MRLLLALGLVLFPSVAFAQAVQTSTTYLVLPTLQGAQARSQTQCAEVGCDGVQTIYWWEVDALTDGTAAIAIQPSGPYGKMAVAKACAAGCGLSPSEIAATVSAASLGGLLPSNSVTQEITQGKIP